MVLGPIEMDRLDWENSHSIKCTDQIKLVMGHAWMNSHLGALMKIELGTLNLIAGTEKYLLQKNINWNT